MKVTVATSALVEAAGHVAGVAASKSPKPVLECVALRARADDGLVLEATDLDVGLRLRLAEAEVQEDGVLVLPAARLLAILREVEEEEVTLQGDDGNLLVESPQGRFRIRGEDPEAFVDLPTFPAEGSLALPGAVLREMIRRTVFATAKEAGRYALHGVLFRLAGDTLELVATDGRRLARIVRSLPGTAASELRVIVGAKGLSVLDRLIGTGDPEVRVAMEERQVLFQVGDSLIVSRLIDGTFPAYDDVIPKVCEHAFTVAGAQFASGLRRAALLTTRDAVSVRMDIAPGTLTIRSRAPEVGEARVEVPIEYEGPEEKMGFNPIFLQDVLKVLDPEGPVRFEFTSSKAPGKITDGEQYAYVIMPIALE